MNETVYTVRILKNLNFFDIAYMTSSIFTALFTAGLFFMAFIQLKILIRNNSLKTILDLEAELHQHKSKIDEVSSKMRIAEVSNQSNLLEIHSDDLEAAIENYFNILDRLCYCILKDYLLDRDWKSEYNDLLKDTVRSNESKFGPGTYFKNIIGLYKKWNDV